MRKNWAISFHDAARSDNEDFFSATYITFLFKLVTYVLSLLFFSIMLLGSLTKYQKSKISA